MSINYIVIQFNFFIVKNNFYFSLFIKKNKNYCETLIHQRYFPTSLNSLNPKKICEKKLVETQIEPLLSAEPVKSIKFPFLTHPDEGGI